jgi:hypothetical protein
MFFESRLLARIVVDGRDLEGEGREGRLLRSVYTHTCLGGRLGVLREGHFCTTFLCVCVLVYSMFPVVGIVSRVHPFFFLSFWFLLL